MTQIKPYYGLKITFEIKMRIRRNDAILEI